MLKRDPNIVGLCLHIAVRAYEEVVKAIHSASLVMNIQLLKATGRHNTEQRLSHSRNTRFH